MKLMKWLKRDRSNRRCSDSHLAMVSSPHDEKLGRNHSLNATDPIRDKEYLQALSEFRARRSLELNVDLDKDIDVTPKRSQKHNPNNEERKSRSEQKPKKKLCPESLDKTQMLSQTLPQIQFLFSNQIFMPGNRPQNRRRRKLQKTTADKNSNNQTNASLNSSDLSELNKKTIDIDVDDSEPPPSPPPEFYRNNSLPYANRDETMPLETSNSSEGDVSLKNMINKSKSSGTRNSQRPFLNSSQSDIYETIKKFSKTSSAKGNKARHVKDVVEKISKYKDDQLSSTDFADSSMGFIARKLEETCRIKSRVSSKGHFRGVPLIRRSALKISNHVVDHTHRQRFYAVEGMTKAHWETVPVILRGALDVEYTAKDIDILTSVHHPNILLLMGITYDTRNRIECVFEECSATLYNILHEQKLHLNLNTYVEYLSDIANAASHLYNSGYIHTAISSHTIIITSRGLAKLLGFELCSKLLIKDSNDSPKREKCEPYKLMYSSPEPEYENLRGRMRHSDSSDKDFHSSEQYKPLCSPQDIDEREMLTHYRWQAPELFDDVDKQVTPTRTTDVYSICLVLWECFNGVTPWSTLSYKHLSDLYLLWQTGIRIKEGRYPILIQDMLYEGLALNHEDRMSIKDLSTKLVHVKNYVHFGSDGTVGDNSDMIINTDLDNSKNQFDEKLDDGEISHNQNVTSSLQNITEFANISKIQVTNIDDVQNNSVKSSSRDNVNRQPLSINLSSIRLDTTDTSVEMSPEQNMTMHKTDSTEYCSFLTPDIKKFASRLQDHSVSLQPSKLTFDESLRQIPENSLQEKIMRLNSNFTPKSYKSLEIKTPPVESLQDLTKLTNRVGSAECERRSIYKFDVKNTSLPNTPIARNTKLRKCAWLSGENEKRNKEFNNKNANSQSIQSGDKLGEKTQKETSISNVNDKHNMSKNSSRGSVDEDGCTLGLDTSDTVDATPFIVPDDENQRNSVRSDLSSSALCTDRNPFRRNFFSGSKAISSNLSNKFRSRSQSWSSKLENNMRGSENNITGVDIRPLVAIHEKWIEEAKQKHNRSLSLPDNYRGPAHAVKPASHRVDPVLPYSPNDKSHSFLTAKRVFKKRSPPKGHYQTIPNTVRAAIAKKKTLFPKSDDFFEHSLWRKEKEKCQPFAKCESNPQKSSTPYRNTSISDSTSQTNQATNTETFEELCEAIIRQIKEQGCFNMLDQTDDLNFNPPSIDVNTDVVNKNSCMSTKSVITNLHEPINVANTDTINISHVGSKVCNSNPFNLPKMENFPNVHMVGCKNMKQFADCENIVNQEEESQSLPEIRGEVIKKCLKRCQAFSTLQTARSTEDMYIDDELSANSDIHALSDNMLFIPMHSSFHEAFCDKANDCCLVKIKEESSSETILIVCDNSQRNIRPQSSSSTTSDPEDELSQGENSQKSILKIETLPSIDLIDIPAMPQGLSVIEEIPGEEESPDSDNNNTKNIQDLINMYENVNESKCKNVSNHYKESRANEISFLILDNMEECDEDLPERCDMKTNSDLRTTDSVIQDYISI